MKKAELVKFAVANVPVTRWLPPELRTAHYDGPATRSALKAVAAKSKKKPAKEDA